MGSVQIISGMPHGYTLLLYNASDPILLLREFHVCREMYSSFNTSLLFDVPDAWLHFIHCHTLLLSIQISLIL
jgi:hypothetical protein